MELLDRIRQAEAETERLVAVAKRDAEDLIRSAREEARELLESEKNKCRLNASRMMVEAESAAHEHSERQQAENLKAIESLRTSAQQRIENAVELIIEAISHNS